MAPATTSTTEVSASPIEAEEPLTAEKVNQFNVAELKVYLQQRTL